MIRVATWNVNSVRQRIEHLVRWLGELKPDVVLLQEIKSMEETFPRQAIEDAGYNVEISGQKTFNGVAILSKHPIDVELNALPGDKSDEQARYLEAFTGGVRVASIYLPNGNPVSDDAKYKYKLKWMARLEKHVRELMSQEEAFVLGGDYNVIPTDEDVYEPDKWRDDALFKLETRAAFRKILYLGLTDAFRALHPDRAGPLHLLGLPVRRVEPRSGIAHRSPFVVTTGRRPSRRMRNRQDPARLGSCLGPHANLVRAGEWPTRRLNHQGG